MDLNGIDLNLLVAFDALMKERSVTRAGARIYRSQPAMSAALSRLRSLLKDELFIRGPDGLQPTPRAMDLAEPLSLALAEIQRVLDFTQEFDPSTSSTTFTIGLSEHPTYLLLPRLLNVLREKAPAMTLHVRGFIARDDAVTMLDAGEVDLVVGVPPTSTSGRILIRPLFEESFVCVVRKDHPVAKTPLDLEKFLELSHLLVSPENDRFGHVDVMLAKHGLKRKLGLTLPHLYAAPVVIAQSDMIATLMQGIIDVSGYAKELCIMKPPLELSKIPFVLAWHRRNDVHPAQRWLRETIASLIVSSE